MTDNLTCHPLEHQWNVFVHGVSDSETYTTNYKKWTEIVSCEDFGSFLAHFPLDVLIHDVQKVLKVQSITVTSVSIFKEPVKPEWEHESNENGFTLSFRTNDDKQGKFMIKLWRDILAYMVGHTCLRGDINGLQLTLKRSTRIGILFKLDLWLPSHTNPTDMISDLQEFTDTTFELIKRA